MCKMNGNLARCLSAAHVPMRHWHCYDCQLLTSFAKYQLSWGGILCRIDAAYLKAHMSGKFTDVNSRQLYTHADGSQAKVTRWRPGWLPSGVKQCGWQYDINTWLGTLVVSFFSEGNRCWYSDTKKYPAHGWWCGQVIEYVHNFCI